MPLCWPLSNKPGHHDRFVLIGHGWLKGHIELFSSSHGHMVLEQKSAGPSASSVVSNSLKHETMMLRCIGSLMAMMNHKHMKSIWLRDRRASESFTTPQGGELAAVIPSQLPPRPTLYGYELSESVKTTSTWQ